MKPPRPDIAVPPFPPAIEWVPAKADRLRRSPGEAPPAVERLTARGPVLVHFIDAGHLSSVRTLPYLGAWQARYGALGLSVLGVNSPRFPWSAEREKLAAALARLAVPFPVASDPEYAVWRSYGCEGWPSSFLWAQGGVLAWFQFGEGEYAATEEEIRSLLPEASREAGLPDPVEPIRPSDAPGARVVPPSEEIFPGGDPARPWRPAAGAEPLDIAYEGAGAEVTVDGRGKLEVRIDGDAEKVLDVRAPGLYELATHAAHGAHRLTLRASTGLEVYSIAFAPGVP